MINLIGLGNKARQGKDTVADYLVSEHGFVKMSWADTLKRGINTWHGWGEEHGWGELKEIIDPYWGYSPRTAYVKIGTDLIRDQWDKDFWIKSAMIEIKARLDSGERVVVADVRFPNELKAIKDLGGQTWRITRPRVVADVNHISEVALDNFEFDEELLNDGILEQLFETVESKLL